jgi:hypothetical protein
VPAPPERSGVPVRRLAVLCAVSLLAAGVLASAAPQARAGAAPVRVAFLQGEQVVYIDRPGSTIRAAVSALLARSDTGRAGA